MKCNQVGRNFLFLLLFGVSYGAFARTTEGECNFNASIPNGSKPGKKDKVIWNRPPTCVPSEAEAAAKRSMEDCLTENRTGCEKQSGVFSSTITLHSNGMTPAYSEGDAFAPVKIDAFFCWGIYTSRYSCKDLPEAAPPSSK